MPHEPSPWHESRRLRVGELHLNVAAAGEGPTVLLLHGFPDSLQLWRTVAPRLIAAGYRVLAVDQRGFGSSDAPVGRKHYAIDLLLEDIAALLQATVTDGPVYAIGHDWGAVITWCLAMTRPDLLRSAVAISVGHPREYALAGLEQKRKGLYTIGWQVPGISEQWLRTDDWKRMRHWLRHHPHPEECLHDLQRPGRLTAGLNWYRANLLPAVLRTWPACEVPMLGIWSSEDHCLAEDQMARSSRRMAASFRYSRIEHAGHWLPLERPDEVASLAIEWFREHPDRK